MSVNKRLISVARTGAVSYSSWDVSGLTLSTTTDIESAGYLNASNDSGFSFDVNPQGNRITFWGATEGLDYGFGDMTTDWDTSTITNYTIQNATTTNYRIPYSAKWSSDGNNFYIFQTQFPAYNGLLRQWELSSSFDSATYNAQTRTLNPSFFRAGDVYMSKDGTKMIISEQHRNGGTTSYIYTYSLSTAFNISTATQTSSYTLSTANFGNYGCWFDVNEDFGQIYIADGRGYLRYATISNLDVSTISLNPTYDLNVSSINATAFRFRIKPDSSKVLMAFGDNLYVLN